MIASLSSDGRYVVVVFETGEAIAFRDALVELKTSGKLGDLGNALTSLLPTRFVLVSGRKKTKKKGRK